MPRRDRANGPTAQSSAPRLAIRAEHRLPAIVAILVAVAVNATLPEAFRILPIWVLPVISLGMLVPLVFLNPMRLDTETAWSRALSIAFAVLLTVVNQLYVVALIVQLVDATAKGSAVLLAALQIWVTNAVAFALVYWEVDRGGPVARRVEGMKDDAQQDFQFPQQSSRTEWEPGFVDYGYFSLTNMMAFSPTDVMPLSHRAKGLMAAQGITAFVILALVISRAVNILG